MTVEQLNGIRPSLADRSRRHVDLTRVLTWLLVAASVGYMLAFLLTAYFRLTYAQPLHAMESPAMQAVRRILHAQPLYGARRPWTTRPRCTHRCTSMSRRWPRSCWDQAC